MNKTPLAPKELESLKNKGIIKHSEIAYRDEKNILIAEDPISGLKRVVDTFGMMKESKDVLFG